MPTQQDFLFVDAAQAKTSRQGRRNARSFVMQNARRKNPWSTSKHAAKQRKTGSPEGASPSSIATSDSTHTPKTATPSPPIIAYRPDYFPSQHLSDPLLTKGEVCPDCHIFLCRPGQRLCPRCILLKPAAPVEVPNNQLFDPFRTSSVEITKSVSELLAHCKFGVWICHAFQNRGLVRTGSLVLATIAKPTSRVISSIASRGVWRCIYKHGGTRGHGLVMLHVHH